MIPTNRRGRSPGEGRETRATISCRATETAESVAARCDAEVAYLRRRRSEDLRAALRAEMLAVYRSGQEIGEWRCLFPEGLPARANVADHSARSAKRRVIVTANPDGSWPTVPPDPAEFAQVVEYHIPVPSPTIDVRGADPRAVTAVIRYSPPR